jgi:predicted ATPase
VPDRKAGVEALLRSEAVQLFVERARLQKPGFSLTEREAPAIAELCARLDGIPLALELAAARLRSLSVSDINARLNDRFKLLTGGSRVALERQQTLRALVSWSYDLLQENEQIVLDRLSVFAGGFDLQAAEAVCGADPIAPEDVLDLVTSLVEKSLVMLEQEGDGSRYGLLETIKEFAHEHLSKRFGLLGTIQEFAQERLKDRDDVAATAARHCDYFLGIAKTARTKLEGPEQAEWMRRVEVDLDNLRAAIALALAGEVDPVIAVEFEAWLMRFRILRGYSTEGRTNIRAALALPVLQERTKARANALYVGGALAMNQSDYAEATKMLTECLAIRRELGNARGTAAALSTLSTTYVQQDEIAKARACEEEAIGIFRELGDGIGEAIGLLNLGEIFWRQADHVSAQDLFEQCLAIARSIKHQELESECERDLGELALGAGNLQAARARFTRSLKVCRDAEDKRGEAITLWHLGRTDMAGRDFDAAREKLAEAMRALQAFEMNSELLDCLEDYAQLLQHVGRVEIAVRAYAAVACVREALRLPRSSPRGGNEREESIKAARTALGSPAFEAAWSAGRAWGLDEAVERALASATDQAVTV